MYSFPRAVLYSRSDIAYLNSYNYGFYHQVILYTFVLHIDDHTGGCELAGVIVCSVLFQLALSNCPDLETRSSNSSYFNY